ncbi:MAG: energy-coupling factor transporter transmembrane protein EcfT [Chloroflexales bacterium]|nr:energy-coupling factor transporter transmembrane protein EcfT [Chloroflexales bacterium]
MATPKEITMLHRLHPLTKLSAAFLMIIASYLVAWLPLPLLIFGLLLLLGQLSGVGRPLFNAVLRVVLPVTFSLFLIQGILFPPVDATPLQVGPMTLTYEGLEFAFVISSRLLVLTTTVLLLLQTTHPADLVNALTQRGLPRSIGYVLLVSLQIVPDMSARATAILDAQRSRGLETQGGLRRVRAIVPLVGSLVVGALLDVEERAMAIESRAYTTSGPKTILRQLADTPAQRAARLLLLLALVGLIVWRLVGFWF